jgi:hypothetical protein
MMYDFPLGPSIQFGGGTEGPFQFVCKVVNNGFLDRCFMYYSFIYTLEFNIR